MIDTIIKAQDLPPDYKEQLNKDRVVCGELVSLFLNREVTNPPSIRQLHTAFDTWLEHYERKQNRFRLFVKKIPPIPPDVVALSFGAILGDHIIVGDTAKAIAMSKKLLEHGIFVIGFGFPVVPEGTARLRIQMSAAHENEHVDQLVEALKKL